MHAVLKSRCSSGPFLIAHQQGIESWVSFDMSHARNSSSLAAVSSYETVVDAPHARHLHLWDPAPVLPFLFIAAPQEGHLTAFISSSLEIGNLRHDFPASTCRAMTIPDTLSVRVVKSTAEI